MEILLWIIISTFLISMIAFIGILTLSMKEELIKKIVSFLVSLSAGALMGGAFLHLMPEAVEKSEDPGIFIYVLVGFTLFFLVEKLLCWRHCHEGKCPVHTFAYMNLLGDGVHNFIDGLIISASFVTNIPLGIATTIAVALHEIPQEIGDFGVLVYGGIKRTRALLLNFVCAITAVLGGVFGYFLSDYMGSSILFLLPFAAGGFVYIAASDLIPEIRKEVDIRKSLLSLGIFITGILIMYATKFIAHE